MYIDIFMMYAQNVNWVNKNKEPCTNPATVSAMANPTSMYLAVVIIPVWNFMFSYYKEEIWMECEGFVVCILPQWITSEVDFELKSDLDLTPHEKRDLRDLHVLPLSHSLKGIELYGSTLHDLPSILLVLYCQLNSVIF